MTTNIETDRLIVRSFTMDDLDDIHRILAIDTGWNDMTLTEDSDWLRWTIASEFQLGRLYQPPYGDRAIVLKESGKLIGCTGLVPSYGPFEQLPYFSAAPIPNTLFRPEVGLFWVVESAYRNQGYATEAARGLINFAFRELRLKRIIATTEYTNEASQGVMRRLGMDIQRNPFADPVWFQVVGVLENT